MLEWVLQRLRGVYRSSVHPYAETQNGITFYKVRIGPIADVDHVDALTAKLTGLGFTNAQVVIP